MRRLRSRGGAVAGAAGRVVPPMRRGDGDPAVRPARRGAADRAAGRVVPPARQGPGRLAGAAVARLDLGVHRRLHGVLPGDHLTAGLGAGTELAQLRPYEAGDDVRRLDPAASARTGIPHVRLQVPERAVTTWLVVDVTASMAFGTAQRLKSDVAEGVAEAVGHVAVRRGGRLGLAIAGPTPARVLRPRGGRAALAAVRALVGQGVLADGAGAPGALAGALDRVSRLARSRGVVVIVSDFREEGWVAALRRIGAHHAVVAVEVADPREATLPDAGHLFLVDPETGDVVEADTAARGLRDAFAAAESARRAGVAAVLRRAGARHVAVATDGDWLRELGRALR